MKMLQEASLDEAFNTQMKKVQDAIDKLNGIVDKMQADGSMNKLTRTQLMQLRYAAEDFKKLQEKAQ